MARTIYKPRRSVFEASAEAAAAVPAAAVVVVDTTTYDLKCKTDHARAEYKGSVDKMVRSVQTFYEATIIIGLGVVNANAQKGQNHHAAAALAQAEMITATSEMEERRSSPSWKPSRTGKCTAATTPSTTAFPFLSDCCCYYYCC